MTIFSLKNITKSYKQGDENITILDNISLNLDRGEIMSLMGPSGCGKSSLLHIAGLLDKPDSGEIIIDGQNCLLLSDKEKTFIRANKLGFVYQFHHLLPEFTAMENLIIPQLIINRKKSKATQIAENFLDIMGLSNRKNHLPSELSGGECQRIAIARALVNSPNIILADEPTGNLDPAISEMVFDLLLCIVKEANICGLIVTHNYELADKASIKAVIKNGRILY